MLQLSTIKPNTIRDVQSGYCTDDNLTESLKRLKGQRNVTTIVPRFGSHESFLVQVRQGKDPAYMKREIPVKIT